MGKRKEMIDMKNGRIIKVLVATEGITMTELAKRVGISRQGLYKRLRGDMMLGSFKECLNAMGYDLYYGKDGEIKKI